MPEYIIAKADEDFAAATALFKEYAGWLGIDLSFQHFEEELNQLKQMYNTTDGGIILCKDEDKYVGCVAVRRIDTTTGELKRMYVQPAYHKKGIGKALLEKSLQLAKDCGYAIIRLDTLNDMLSAMNLYKANGFKEIPAYYFNPDERAVYFEKSLINDIPNYFTEKSWTNRISLKNKCRFYLLSSDY